MYITKHVAKKNWILIFKFNRKSKEPFLGNFKFLKYFCIEIIYNIDERNSIFAKERFSRLNWNSWKDFDSSVFDIYFLSKLFLFKLPDM